jgi:UDP-N-acetylglucosamine 4,6-dehydratase
VTIPSLLTSVDASSVLTGRNVFVTGGSGSFGETFVRRALAANARRVVIFSRGEFAQAELGARLHDDRLRFFIGDVRDKERLAIAMRGGVDTVIHAAALKRVEQCEANPSEAVATNVMGSLNVASAAIDAGVERCVFLSTDKAPAAHTLYGATKFCAERSWLAANVYAAGGRTRLAATRYGNVLGSKGSVVQLWRQQAARGERLTVTHPDATRFWMTLEQAVDLVCLALANMRSGEVFVPKVPSGPIVQLAAAIAPQALHGPCVGLRPGERVHETLISSDESRTTYDAGTHYVIEPESRSWGTVAPLPYPKVADGFAYKSDTNAQQFTTDELRRLVA